MNTSLPPVDSSYLQLEAVGVWCDDDFRIAVLVRRYGGQNQYATVVLDHQFVECEFDFDYKRWGWVVRPQ